MINNITTPKKMLAVFIIATLIGIIALFFYYGRKSADLDVPNPEEDETVSHILFQEGNENYVYGNTAVGSINAVKELGIREEDPTQNVLTVDVTIYPQVFMAREMYKNLNIGDTVTLDCGLAFTKAEDGNLLDENNQVCTVVDNGAEESLQIVNYATGVPVTSGKGIKTTLDMSSAMMYVSSNNHTMPILAVMFFGDEEYTKELDITTINLYDNGLMSGRFFVDQTGNVGEFISDPLTTEQKSENIFADVTSIEELKEAYQMLGFSEETAERMVTENADATRAYLALKAIPEEEMLKYINDGDTETIQKRILEEEDKLK